MHSLVDGEHDSIYPSPKYVHVIVFSQNNSRLCLNHKIKKMYITNVALYQLCRKILKVVNTCKIHSTNIINMRF
jgi:hypothetical protein